MGCGVSITAVAEASRSTPLAKGPEHRVLGGFGHGGNFFEQERDTRRRIAREGRSVVHETAGMKKQKGGHIINLSSVYGHKVGHTAAVCCATKFAMRALSDARGESLQSR